MAGRLETLVLRSRALDNARLVSIYVPATHDEARLPTIYFGDGDLYVDGIRAHEVLDGLIQSRAIAPVVGVFVPPVVRREEYRRSETFRRMMVSELVPLIESRYRTGGAASRRCLIVSSRGALMSLDLALAHPSVFGSAGLLSPAFSGSDLLSSISAGRTAEVSPLRLVIADGQYDREWNPDAVAAQKTLQEAGHQVTRWTYPDGHNPTAWKAALLRLFPQLLAPPADQR